LEKVAKIPGNTIKSFKGKEFKYLTPGEQPDLPKATFCNETKTNETQIYLLSTLF